MKCPIDGAELVMSERQGIEIDYCRQCRGVWLDRGELDKIIERSAAASSPEPARAQNYGDRGRERDHRPDDDRDRRDHYQKPYKKRKSFLDDIFDF